MNSRLITVFSHCGSVSIRNLKGFKNAAAPEAATALVGPRTQTFTLQESLRMDVAASM